MAEVLILVHVMKNALAVDTVSSFDWHRIEQDQDPRDYKMIANLRFEKGAANSKTPQRRDDLKNLGKERGTQLRELKIRALLEGVAQATRPMMNTTAAIWYSQVRAQCLVKSIFEQRYGEPCLQCTCPC